MTVAVFLLASLLPAMAVAQSDVVINEIMYQPTGSEETLEFVELHNPTASTIDLGSYSFTSGIAFDFRPGTFLAAGGHLVVVKDLQAFRSAYPGVTTYVGNFAGQLDNAGEIITLSKLVGDSVVPVDTVDYNDGGKWPEEADGSGASLELIHAGYDNALPEAWAAGLNPTPGAANTNHQANPPPIVRDVLHTPAVPQAGESITVTAKVNTTTSLADLIVTLHHRLDAGNPGAFQSVSMFDDGSHGDGEAGDGIYGVTLPGQDNDTIKAFQIQVDDTVTFTSKRVPSTDPDVAFLCLFQNSSSSACEFPTYHILMTEATRLELESRSTRSNVLLDATLIKSSGSVFYNCGVRYRGNGSRNLLTPPDMNYRISLPPGEKIDGHRDLNFNGSFPLLQWIGMDAFRRSGNAASDTEFCSIKLNQTLLVPNQGAHYVRVEAFNRNYAANHWPDSSEGNMYKGAGGRFQYIDDDVDSYKPLYQKETNQYEDQWQDIVNATSRFDNTTAPNYVTQLDADGGIDIDQWVNHLAMHAALANDENGFYNGRGDDYAFYHHPARDRMLLIPWDMDSVIDVPDVNESLFLGGSQPVNNFRNHPQIRPRYLRRVMEHLDRILDDASMNSRFDAMGCAITSSYRETLLDLIEQRRNYVLTTHGSEPLVPVSPTALSVSLEGISGARLDWTDNSSDESGFAIERSADGYSWAMAGSTDSNVTTFLDPGLGHGVAVYYRVRAVNAPGTSYPSNYVSVFPGPWIEGGPVIINEVLTHTDLPEVDSIELYNPNLIPVNIGGWYLTDNVSVPKKFRIPDGTTIPAGGHLVFDESDFSVGTNAFRLSEHGEDAYLFSADANENLTGYSQGWKFRAAPNGVSTGRYVDSQGKVHFVLQASKTPQAENSLPLVGPVVISEIHYRPPDLDGGVDNAIDEFIELTNISSSSVSLYHTDTSVPGYGDAALNDTWRLRNAVDFDFPPGVELPPGDRLLVVGFDPLTDTAQLAGFRSKYDLDVSVEIYGPWSGKLDNAGEEIELKYPGTADSTDSFFVPYYTMEEIDYRDSAPWPEEADGRGFSLQRRVFNEFGNDPLNWRADRPQKLSGPDTDDDAMDDSWEILHGLVVGVDDSALDPDRDGRTNLEEFLARTLPFDAASYLDLTMESTATGVKLRFTAAPDVAYTIQSTASITHPINWTDMQQISAESEQREIVFEFEPSVPRRFFQLIVRSAE